MQGLFQNLVKLCRFSRAEKDEGQYTSQQVEYMDKVGDAFVMMPYGLHANIPEDYLGILFQAGGQENNRLAFPLSTKERVKNLESGELILYHPVKKTFIKFNNAGDIEINTNGKVNVTATEVTLSGDATITGNVAISGNCSVTGNLTQNNVDVGSLHTHTQPNDSAGDTQMPTNVVTP